jgi:hypothetical protein
MLTPLLTPLLTAAASELLAGFYPDAREIFTERAA